MFLFCDYIWLIPANLDACYFISTVILNEHAGNTETGVEAVLFSIEFCVYLYRNQ